MSQNKLGQQQNYQQNGQNDNVNIPINQINQYKYVHIQDDVLNNKDVNIQIVDPHNNKKSQESELPMAISILPFDQQQSIINQQQQQQQQTQFMDISVLKNDFQQKNVNTENGIYMNISMLNQEEQQPTEPKAYKLTGNSPDTPNLIQQKTNKEENQQQKAFRTSNTNSQQVNNKAATTKTSQLYQGQGNHYNSALHLNNFSLNGLYRHFTMNDTFNVDAITKTLSLKFGFFNTAKLSFKAGIILKQTPIKILYYFTEDQSQQENNNNNNPFATPIIKSQLKTVNKELYDIKNQPILPLTYKYGQEISFLLIRPSGFSFFLSNGYIYLFPPPNTTQKNQLKAIKDLKLKENLTAATLYNIDGLIFCFGGVAHGKIQDKILIIQFQDDLVIYKTIQMKHPRIKPIIFHDEDRIYIIGGGQPNNNDMANKISETFFIEDIFKSDFKETSILLENKFLNLTITKNSLKDAAVVNTRKGLFILGRKYSKVLIILLSNLSTQRNEIYFGYSKYKIDKVTLDVSSIFTDQQSIYYLLPNHKSLEQCELKLIKL